MTILVSHARKLMRGSEGERLGLDLSLYPTGLFFLQADGVLYYTSEGTWYALATEGNPVEGLTLHSQGSFLDYDPGSHTPPADHWFLVALDEGLFLVSDMGFLNGPLVMGGVAAGGETNIYKETTGGLIYLRGLSAGANIVLTEYGNEINISANLIDTPIGGENINTGGGSEVYVNTLSNTLRFRGLLGVDGIATSHGVDYEINIGMDVGGMPLVTGAIDHASDLIPYYDGAHKAITPKQILDPQAYYGYQTLGTFPIIVEMTNAETWYGLMRTATVWTVGYSVGEYLTGGECVEPPSSPTVQTYQVNITGYFQGGTTLEVQKGSPGVVVPGFSVYIDANLHGTISMSGIIETADNTNILSVVAKNEDAGWNVDIYHMDVTIHKITGV